MGYTPPVKGKFLKKSVRSPIDGIEIINSLVGVPETLFEIRDLRDELIEKNR